MPIVLIDGVEYIPKADVPELTDCKLKEALELLTDIQYFHECTHKHRAWAWGAMHAIAPELAELASNDPDAAYERILHMNGYWR